ncbi:MAG TPA: hypothetical protein VF502_04165 [Stellaceae bacterium]
MSAMSLSPSQLRARAGLGLPRVPRALRVVVALGLIAALACALHVALRSPGQAIRGELKAAAADLRVAPPAPSGPVLKGLSGHFPHRLVSIDSRVWPQVSVTLHGLTRDACRDAASVASRIEGLVVVELENYRAADDCGDANDMTWRIMP